MAAEKRFNVEAWEPKTQVGKMVKEGTITDIDYILDNGLPLLEPEIVDALLPDITEQVLDVSLVQRMHKSGRRARFRATVAVGNKNGYVGVGIGKAKEVGPAIRKAIAHAKLSLIRIRLGCGSWECGCGTSHSIPFTAKGSCASVKIELLPAPRGGRFSRRRCCKGSIGSRRCKRYLDKNIWRHKNNIQLCSCYI